MITSKNELSYEPDLQSVIDGVPECILVISPDYEIKLMNKAAREFLSNYASEFQQCYKIFHHREKPYAKHNCMLEEVRKTGQSARIVHEHYNSNGEKRSIEILSSPLYGSDGTFNGIIQYLRDITINEQGEKDLGATIAAGEDEKSRSRAIIAALGDGIIIQDTDYKIIYQNQIQKDLYGDKKGELCYRAYEGSDKICEDCPVEKTFIDGKIHRSERRIPTDKGISFYELISSPLKDSKGKIIAGVKVVRDITERKRMEEKLRNSEEKYRTLVETLMEGIWVLDKDANTRFVNPRMAQMLGYTIDEMMGKHLFSFMDEPGRMNAMLYLEGCAQNVKEQHDFEFIRKDGTRIYTSLETSPIYDEKGNYSGAIAAIADITERKHAEEQLRQSHNLLEAIRNAQSTFIKDSDKRILFDNILQKLISLTQSEYGLIGDVFYNTEGNPYLKITHAITNITSNKEEVIEIKAPLGKEFTNLKTLFGQVIISGKPLISNNPSGDEWKDEVPEGHPKLNSFMVLPFYHGNKSVGIAGIANRPGGYDEGIANYLQPLLDTSANIIEAYKNNQKRKQAEVELRESERFMESVFASIQDGIGIIDREMNIIKVNKTAETWYPYAVPLIGKKCYEAYHNRTGPCELCPAQETFVTGKSAYKVVPKHGPGGKEVGWLEIYSYPLKEATTGQMKGVIEYVRDITERKLVEEELKQSEEKYRLLIENILEGVFIIQDSKLQFVNEAFAKKTGYRVEEIIGLDFHRFVAPEDLEMVQDRYSRRQKGEDVPNEYEFHLLCKGGIKIIVSMSVGIVTYRGRIASMGVLRDITERKRKEEDLAKSRMMLIKAQEIGHLGSWEWNIVTNELIWSKEVYNIYGLDPSEVTPNYDLVLERMTPESKNDILKAIDDAFTLRKPFEMEYSLIRPDGTRGDVHTKGEVLFDLDDHPIIMYGMVQDITERKQAENALRLSNLVVENSQTILFRWKAQEDWPVEFVSKNVVQFGYSAQDFLSGALPYASFIYPDDLERVLKEVKMHSQSGNDRFQQEYRIMAKDGAVHWIENSMVIERNRDGQITHYQGIIIDVTERKNIEEAINKYNRKLEESNHIKQLFTDIMHHDLLNPLNVAQGYVELFLQDETDHQKKSYLETIRRNLLKGMELIENATKFSKLESMDYIEFEDLDLKNVLGEVIENITPLALRAGMSVENNLKKRMPARANKIIEDIFINIISNAIKYASLGKRIVVDGKDGGSSWIIRIVDFGPGIKDTDKKMIFERFHREEKKGVKGSGLGLAIAGKIVELHQGRIWVEDNPEGGAIFIIELPKS